MLSSDMIPSCRAWRRARPADFNPWAWEVGSRVSDVVQLVPRTIDWYVEHLQDGVPFSLSRWGDGEWRSVLAENNKCWERLSQISRAWRKGKTNKSGHSFPDEMGVQLRELLSNKPQYTLALADRFARADAPLPQIGLAKWIKQWLVQHDLAELRWCSADTLVRALYQKQFGGFLSALQQYESVVIGPAHLKKLKTLNMRYFVEAPRRDAFKAIDSLAKMACKYLERTKDHLIVSISIGPAAALLVDRLHGAFGPRHTILDLGSIWDPFVGEISRSYMKRDDVMVYVRKLQASK